MKALEIKFQGGGQSPWSTPGYAPVPGQQKKSISQLQFKLQFIIPHPLPGQQKGPYLRILSSNIHQFVQNIYVNKMKLKWQNCFKQKIYRCEKKFIKSREEAYINNLYINYIFSLRAVFMQCISFIQGTSFKMRFTISNISFFYQKRFL